MNPSQTPSSPVATAKEAFTLVLGDRIVQACLYAVITGVAVYWWFVGGWFWHACLAFICSFAAIWLRRVRLFHSTAGLLAIGSLLNLVGLAALSGLVRFSSETAISGTFSVGGMWAMWQGGDVSVLRLMRASAQVSGVAGGLGSVTYWLAVFGAGLAAVGWLMVVIGLLRPPRRPKTERNQAMAESQTITQPTAKAPSSRDAFTPPQQRRRMPEPGVAPQRREPRQPQQQPQQVQHPDYNSW